MWAARRFVSGPSRPIFSGVSGGTNRDERSVTKPISDPVPCRRRNGHCPTTFSAFPLSVSHRSPIRYFAFPSNYHCVACERLYETVYWKLSSS